VTGVQTCALPISGRVAVRSPATCVGAQLALQLVEYDPTKQQLLLHCV
jgi:hypothetical protein